MKVLWIAVTLLVVAAVLDPAFGVERFPPPDFSEGHVVPDLVVRALILASPALGLWLPQRLCG